jgi:prophage DNA circulation protein
MMAEWCQADVELEALRASVALVRDLVLGVAGRSSSLVAPLATMVEEDEKWTNATTANGVRWRARSALVTVLSHFPELETEVELLGSGRGTDLSDDQSDALLLQVSVASDSLASLVSSSMADDSLGDMQ